MKILLDTHAFLWWNMNSPQLSAKAKEIIAEGNAEIYFSAASAWEIAIKCKKGSLILPEPPDAYIHSRIRYYNFVPMPIQMSHCLRTYDLPYIHQDPFDRLLVSQCQLENMSIISIDKNIAQYDVQVIW